MRALGAGPFWPLDFGCLTVTAASRKVYNQGMQTMSDSSPSNEDLAVRAAGRLHAEL